MTSTTTTGSTSTIYVGQLRLDMYDNAKKELVWRGVASKTIDPKAKPEKQQSAKRPVIPSVLDRTEISALLRTLDLPCRRMVFLAAATGLRASDLLALKWGDISFDSLEISLNRGVVHQVIGDVKTEASRKPLPLDPDMAQSLLAWRRASPFNRETDRVFASPEMDG